MKKKPGFVLRELCGSNVIVAEGIENIDFNNLVELNETSAFIWENISNEFTEESIVDLLCENYDVDRAIVVQDVKDICNEWIKLGMVE